MGRLSLHADASPFEMSEQAEFPRTMVEQNIVAEEVQALTGSNSKIVYEPLPQDDPKQRQPDITRARTLLGWEPKVPLEEGLKETIAYFREVATRKPTP